MNLNNFRDIFNLTKSRCNVADTTDFDDIIKMGINYAYMELKGIEPTISTDTVTSSDNLAILPENCHSILEINPQLYVNEYKKGNTLILKRDEDVTFNIVYTVVPDPLMDTDIPEISRKYWYCMSTYGCYAYYNYKKKLNEAQAYYSEYLSQINNAEPNDQTQVQIQNVYSSLLGVM